MERDEIRLRLYQNRLSYTWLIWQLEKRGIMTDKTEMSTVISGTRKGPKADQIVQEAIAVLNEYETHYPPC